MDNRTELLSRLAKHRAIGHAPASEHAWLVDHGQITRYELGAIVTRAGEQADFLYIVLSGHMVIRKDRGAGANKIFEWRGGDIAGMMPYSRKASPPADVVVEESAEGLAIPKDCFPDLIRACPVVTAATVHAMVDRARMFTSSDWRDEKLVSLGKLSAGLAHELNNPASAAASSAKRLAGCVNASEVAARRLAALKLSDEQLAAIDTMRALCVTPPPLEGLSAVGRADREEALADWMGLHGVAEASAEPLVDTGVTIEALDTFARSVSGEALDAALVWLSAASSVRGIASEIEMATARIDELVAAVKGFSYMDHAPTAEPIDIRRGIADTLTILRAEIRAKQVHVGVELAKDLPCAIAVGAELNQVWMNLLDNAIDAAPSGGNITIAAGRDRDYVSVRIIDDGPGIPADLKHRIFDLFFTTKALGKGTGVGLNTVQRIVRQHGGHIDVDSAPGRTEFHVRVPAETRRGGSG